MVREFSEEKRQEIFRLLDEIDMREWKSFMEWCGSRKEEFGDWPDKLSVSAYTRYVDQYHEKVLETNEMTRQQVNTVFENVAEIDARYAARLRECQEKIKGQIAIVKTMTEFMDSMTNGITSKAHRSGGGSASGGYGSGNDDKGEENTEPEVIVADEIFFGSYEERGSSVLTQCLRGHGVSDQKEISRIVEWVINNNFDLLKELYYADINGINSSQNKDVIYNEIMGNYYAYAGLGSNRKVIELNCYWVREDFSLLECGTEEYLKYISSLYQSGYISVADYNNMCKDDVSENDMQKYFDHVITTVYIYNSLQVLAGDKFTPEDCCEVNEIFRSFGITNRNSIACLLICCAGESGGFKYIREIYEENEGYGKDESGVGFLQVTLKETQEDCLQYIEDLANKGELVENQGIYTGNLEDYPWTASAWYWAVYPKGGKDNEPPLNSYVVDRLDDNGGKLTLGIVLTAECFVHGDVSEGNGLDPVLRHIARDDSLRSVVAGDGGWYIEIKEDEENEENEEDEEDEDNKNYELYIPHELLEEIKSRISNEGVNTYILSVWGQSTELSLGAPYNWAKFENYYNDMQAAGLIDFDLNTELP